MALDALSDAIDDHDPGVRSAAITAVAAVGREEGVAPPSPSSWPWTIRPKRFARRR